MTLQKIEALRSIGFEWAKQKGESAWEQKFVEVSTMYTFQITVSFILL